MATTLLEEFFFIFDLGWYVHQGAVHIMQFLDLWKWMWKPCIWKLCIRHNVVRDFICLALKRLWPQLFTIMSLLHISAKVFNMAKGPIFDIRPVLIPFYCYILGYTINTFGHRKNPYKAMHPNDIKFPVTKIWKNRVFSISYTVMWLEVKSSRF